MTTETQSARVERAYASVKSRLGAPCDIALILGSGLGQLADAIDHPVIIPYGELMVPVSTAPATRANSSSAAVGRLSWS